MINVPVLNKETMDSVTIDKYARTMARTLWLAHPELSNRDIESAVRYSINKRYRNENAQINNNYTHKIAPINLLKLSDYIADREPIITAWGVLWKRHGTVANPLIDMIKGFMDGRSDAKKQMFKFPKGSEDYEMWNLKQLLLKLDANATYGVLGMYSSLYYNIHVAASITTQGRSLVSAMGTCFEAFLANNTKFGSMNEVVTFIDNVLNERPERQFNDKVILDKDISREECFIKVAMTCGFEWMPCEKELEAIWNIIKNINQDDINRIYYKNNLYEFMNNSVLQNSLKLILETLETPFLNPNDPPKEIKEELELFSELLYEYVYYHHLNIDLIDRMDNMVKSVCAISDTDSTIISLDAWYRYNLEHVKNENFKFMDTHINIVKYIEGDEDFAKPIIGPVETERDYDFFEEKTIEIQRSINPIQMIPQDGLRYSLINILAYTLDKVINDYMERYTIASNSYRGPKQCLIIAKNEFLFKRVLLTMNKKNYATIQELQEGNMVDRDHRLDIKGLSIDKSTMNMTTREKLKEILYNDILMADNLDQMKVVKELAIFQDDIYQSLRKGEKKYYKPITVKSMGSYDNPLRIQGIKASIAWNALRGEAEAINLSERNALDIIKTNINATTAEKIKDSHPLIYAKIIELVGSKDKEPTTKQFKEAFKGNITSIAIPRDVKVPEWLLEFIDYTSIINDNICNFPIESIGIRRSGSNKVNYTNIVPL